MAALTFVHVVISLLGIASGLIVLYGLLAPKRLDMWTGIFLATTVATSVTGFFFPVDRFLPSHAVGLISLGVLALAIVARYVKAWPRMYAINAVIALYLNVFVLIVQLFQKLPALKVLAPTQSEPPFLITQLVVLVSFTVFGVAAGIRFHLEPIRIAS